MENKKGQVTILLFLYVFIVFLGIIFLGLAIFFFSQINSVLSQDVDVGQVNLQTINADTFGAITTGFVNAGDTMGLFIIFGLIAGMMLTAFFFGDDTKLWIPIDMIILVFVFILSVYIAQAYSLLINSTPLLDVYIEDLPKTSTLLINLPLIVSTVGAILMVLTYSGLRKDQERELNVFGQ